MSRFSKPLNLLTVTPYEQKLRGRTYTLRFYDPEVGDWVGRATSLTGIYLLTGFTFQDEGMKVLMQRADTTGHACGTDKMGWQFDVWLNGAGWASN